jgi:hypothetical protein
MVAFSQPPYENEVMILVPAVILATLMTASADQAGPPPPALVFTPAPASLPQVHRFWDWQNVALFSGVAAARTFDFFSTSKFRDKHLKEWLLDDETVDNRPLFASIEVAGTALSIAASYAFHRTGHHRLERWVSILHVGIATAGGIWNCTLPNGL